MKRLNRDQEEENEVNIPRPDDFYAHTSAKRRELTENDRKRNAGVDKLFDSIIPGLPIDTDPSETRTQAVQLSQSIESLLKKMNINSSPWIDDLTAEWTKLVPEAVSKYAYPGKWDQGILYIYVSSSIHLFEIRRMYLRKIEQSIRAFAKDRVKIRQIRLMVNAVPPIIHS